MYKHERKMLHQTHVQIPAKFWILIFEKHENMTPHSRKKLFAKNAAKLATTKQTLTTKFQTNNSVVSKVWVPALAYATLFRKQ